MGACCAAGGGAGEGDRDRPLGLPPTTGEGTQGHAGARAARLRDAVAKEKFRVLRNLLGDPLLVRLDGKKRHVGWAVVRARFSDLLGPRVRQALAEGKLRRVGRHWVVGDRVILIGLTQHGIGCGLVVLAVFEEPPSERR